MNIQQSVHWRVTAKRGFLTPQDPHHIWSKMIPHLTPLYTHLPSDCDKTLVLALIIPDLLKKIKQLPDFSHITQTQDIGALEMWFTLYGYLASALVGNGATAIPLEISEPLTTLSEHLQRPPMLSYTGMVLNNWRLIDPQAGYTPENIALLIQFTDLIDESWFLRVHVAIEGQAGTMLQALVDVEQALEADDTQAILTHLRTMQRGLVQITRTFHMMPELCDPDVYFQQVRPYFMSFGKAITFEGITPNPTPLRGGSGAQSSFVPAMLASLGLDHADSELTENLDDMRRYMPQAHRDFVSARRRSRLRSYCETQAPLRDAYNHVLRRLITFRRAHLYYARTYIFEKSTNPIGTGGTAYMSFLSQLIDETEQQFL
ncbi:MAG: hypothetical protein ACFE0Q_11170 [Anaerolineae bacterium]